VTIFQMAVRAYEAYSEDAGNKNYRGEEMPSWGDLPAATQRHWVKAIEAVTRPAPANATESVQESLNRSQR
jgi:hypothetical protein